MKSYVRSCVNLMELVSLLIKQSWVEEEGVIIKSK